MHVPLLAASIIYFAYVKARMQLGLQGHVMHGPDDVQMGSGDIDHGCTESLVCQR